MHTLITDKGTGGTICSSYTKLNRNFEFTWIELLKANFVGQQLIDAKNHQWSFKMQRENKANEVERRTKWLFSSVIKGGKGSAMGVIREEMAHVRSTWLTKWGKRRIPTSQHLNLGQSCSWPRKNSIKSKIPQKKLKIYLLQKVAYKNMKKERAQKIQQPFNKS